MFNTYGANTKTIGGDSKVIWRKVNGLIQGGGTVSLSDINVGDVIPAGTAVALDVVGGIATICKSADEVTAAKGSNTMFGLILNDIHKDEGDVIGTCAVVVDGEIYVNRLADDNAIKAAVAVAALSPKIVLLVESALPA